MIFAEYSKETKKMVESLLKGEIPLSASHREDDRDE